MAEEQAQQHHGEDDDELTPGYKPPAEKSMKEIAQLDQDDEALIKYKQSLGVGAADVPPACKLSQSGMVAANNLFIAKFHSGHVWNLLNLMFTVPNDPRKVIVTKLSFCPDGREEMHLDLSGIKIHLV